MSIMNEKVKAHLTAYCQKNSWGISNNDFEEILIEAKPVFKEIGSAHRWYDEEFRVVNIDGMLIGFSWYHLTGDNSIRDMDLEFDFNSVSQVEKKQRMVDYYEPFGK